MWYSVLTLVLFFVFFGNSGAMHSQALDVTFRARSYDDWKNLWHKEKYSRCRENLLRHLYWACEKDIYRITRRSNVNLKKNFNDLFEVEYPWIPPTKAKRFLRYRRNIHQRIGSSSVTTECCKSTGCTWEEYAEYCPTNKRYTRYLKK